MSDKELEKIEIRRHELLIEERQIKKQRGIKQGLIVGKLEDLACKKHPGAIFDVKGEIPDSFVHAIRIEQSKKIF